MGKYEVHFQKGIVKSAGDSLFSAILVFDSLGWYLGKHQKVMPIASECETPILIIGDLICRDNRIQNKGDMASYNDPYCPRRWLLCSIFEPILQKGKTIRCQQKLVTILAERNFQGSLSSETIFSSLDAPEHGGCLSKARF
ncbi:bifunctional nitrilase/nitrile hydratase nit4b [Quercus suber]|uniref:Bifunctional nitrilase/nitrile hydratase nit4b n=1 Tax=Quercus suber TaxID=58331 RepID=A0AAW0LHR1_QUESU